MKKSHLIIAFTLAVTLIAGGVFFYMQSKNPVTASFKSTRYNVSFEYPTSLGTATASIDNLNNEIVAFSNSDLTIQYPSYEAAPGASLSSNEIKTKNGKTCDLGVYPNGAGTDSLFTYCGAQQPDTMYVVLVMADTQSQIDANKAIMEQIASSLEY